MPPGLEPSQQPHKTNGAIGVRHPARTVVFRKVGPGPAWTDMQQPQNHQYCNNAYAATNDPDAVGSVRQSHLGCSHLGCHLGCSCVTRLLT